MGHPLPESRVLNSCRCLVIEICLCLCRGCSYCLATLGLCQVPDFSLWRLALRSYLKAGPQADCLWLKDIDTLPIGGTYIDLGDDLAYIRITDIDWLKSCVERLNAAVKEQENYSAHLEVQLTRAQIRHVAMHTEVVQLRRRLAAASQYIEEEGVTRNKIKAVEKQRRRPIVSLLFCLFIVWQHSRRLAVHLDHNTKNLAASRSLLSLTSAGFEQVQHQYHARENLSRELHTQVLRMTDLQALQAKVISEYSDRLEQCNLVGKQESAKFLAYRIKAGIRYRDSVLRLLTGLLILWRLTRYLGRRLAESQAYELECCVPYEQQSAASYTEYLEYGPSETSFTLGENAQRDVVQSLQFNKYVLEDLAVYGSQETEGVSLMGSSCDAVRPVLQDHLVELDVECVHALKLVSRFDNLQSAHSQLIWEHDQMLEVLRKQEGIVGELLEHRNSATVALATLYTLMRDRNTVKVPNAKSPDAGPASESDKSRGTEHRLAFAHHSAETSARCMDTPVNLGLQVSACPPEFLENVPSPHPLPRMPLAPLPTGHPNYSQKRTQDILYSPCNAGPMGGSRQYIHTPMALDRRKSCRGRQGPVLQTNVPHDTPASTLALEALLESSNSSPSANGTQPAFPRMHHSNATHGSSNNPQSPDFSANRTPLQSAPFRAPTAFQSAPHPPIYGAGYPIGLPAKPLPFIPRNDWYQTPLHPIMRPVYAGPRPCPPPRPNPQAGFVPQHYDHLPPIMISPSPPYMTSPEYRHGIPPYPVPPFGAPFSYRP
ncbi:hypothetical protein AcW2_005339 [Taiwanofungus camphoratus]|nr:hypothetical protein AcW2_005339 [Antrodia cinnamomea]